MWMRPGATTGSLKGTIDGRHRCLMYAAAAQVLAQASPGVVQLDAGPDDWIYEHGLRLLAD